MSPASDRKGGPVRLVARDHGLSAGGVFTLSLSLTCGRIERGHAVPGPWTTCLISRSRRCRAGQSGRIIRFAHHFTHHWGTAIRTGPGAPGPPAAPGCQNPPAHPARNPPDDPWAPAARIIENSLVYMVNATVRTGKPAVCRGDADPAQPIHRVSPDALTSLISGSVGGSGFSGSAAGGSR